MEETLKFVSLSSCAGVFWKHGRIFHGTKSYKQPLVVKDVFKDQQYFKQIIHKKTYEEENPVDITSARQKVIRTNGYS